MRKVIGWFVLILPFAFMFTVMIATLGWLKFFLAIITLMAVASCIVVGVSFIWPKDNP